MEKKMNISVVLSRNYDKIGLDFLDETISYETEEEFKEIIKQKFKLLKDLVLDEFEKPQTFTQDAPTSPQGISDAQKKFLVDGLGFTGNTDNLTKVEASELIAKLKGN